MPKGVYVRQKSLKKLIRKSEVPPIAEPELPAILKRIFNNEHTQEDILIIGDKITQFKKSELYILVNDTVEYVIKSILDGDEKISNDEKLGIQKGARRVLTTIMGLDKQAIVVNKQMDMRRAQEEAENEDVTDTEDNKPGRLKGHVGI